MTFDAYAWSSIVFVAAFLAGDEAGRALKENIVNFDKLFELVNGAIIVAIMGITTILRQVGGRSTARWIPLVPMILGGACGWLVGNDAMSLRQIVTWSLLYSGAASVGYIFLWKTIMRRGIDDDKEL